MPIRRPGVMAMRGRLERALARTGHTRVASLGAQLARWYLAAVGNFNYDPQSNGERWLIATLADELEVVFDVGANVGDWTAIVRALAPAATVHAFEIVPSTSSALADRFRNDRAVVVNATGLMDADGAVSVHHYRDAPVVSGVLDYWSEDPRGQGVSAETIEAPVTTGATYCRQRGIERVDLLKVDTEGADLQVLRGFEPLLGAQRIRVVQFEYGRASIVSKDLLRDHCAYLTGFGYAIGKLYPGHVDFRPYDIRFDEDFLGPNYVAVAEGEGERLRGRLSRGRAPAPAERARRVAGNGP